MKSAPTSTAWASPLLKTRPPTMKRACRPPSSRRKREIVSRKVAIREVRDKDRPISENRSEAISVHNWAAVESSRVRTNHPAARRIYDRTTAPKLC